MANYCSYYLIYVLLDPHWSAACCYIYWPALWPAPPVRHPTTDAEEAGLPYTHGGQVALGVLQGGVHTYKERLRLLLRLVVHIINLS